MPIFGVNTSATIVRNPGTDTETRWTTQIGGDFNNKVLLQKRDRVRAGDEIHSPYFDEPRVVIRVFPVFVMNGLSHWQAAIVTRSEWDALPHPQQSGTFTPFQPQTTPDLAVFRKNGQVWTLAFEGKTIHLQDAVGLGYIAELLRIPHRPISAVQLVGADVKTSNLAPVSGIPLTDERGLRAVRAELAKMKTALTRLPENDRAHRGDLPQKISRLKEYLGEVQNHRGRAREVAGVEERSRKSVSKAIRQTIDHISVRHPDLGHHLNGQCCKFQSHGITGRSEREYRGFRRPGRTLC